jgi:F-type H+-transporting ATPase subunit b
LLATGALAFSEGGSNIISPDGSLVFILILFMVFVFVMNRLLFRPIGHVLDERESVIDGDTKEARAALQRHNSKLAEYEEAIRRARVEGYQLVEQKRILALQARQKTIDAAKQQAARQIEQAKADITQQAADTRRDLGSEARNIAAQVSSAVLGRTVRGGAD